MMRTKIAVDIETLRDKKTLHSEISTLVSLFFVNMLDRW